MFTEAKLEAGLKSLGLKFKTKTRHGMYSATKDGIRLDIRMGGGSKSQSVWCTYFVRSEAGGYKKTTNKSISTYIGFDEWVKKIDTSLKSLKPAPKMKKKVEPPSPMRFIKNPKDPEASFHKTTIDGDAGFNVRVRRLEATTPQIHWIMSVEIVQMDGILLNSEAHDPDKKIWFHMGCANHLNATFNILTDGEMFLSVDRYRKKNGKFRTTKNTNPKASVNLENMNQSDKDMINFAIQAYMEGQCEDQ